MPSHRFLCLPTEASPLIAEALGAYHLRVFEAYSRIDQPLRELTSSSDVAAVMDPGGLHVLLWDPQVTAKPKCVQIDLKATGGLLRHRLDAWGLIQLHVSNPNTNQHTWLSSRLACFSPADARKWDKADQVTADQLVAISRTARRLFSWFSRNIAVAKRRALPMSAGALQIIEAGYHVQ